MNSDYFQTAFASSAHTLKQLPDDSLVEVAFAGRSNAGKSSAINAITRSRGLAKTSKTPGRTQLINHFQVQPGKYIVDLPGYGYAKVSHKQKQHWAGTLGQYLRQREQLRCLILVMDIRRPLTPVDWQTIEIQQSGYAELHLLLTKADKVSKSARQLTLQQTRDELEEAGIEATLQLFSASEMLGMSDAHAVLDAYLFDAVLDNRITD